MNGCEQLHLFDPPPTVSKLGEVWGYFWSTPRGQDVKHGITNSIKNRRGALQTGNPEDLILMGAYPNFSQSLEDATKEHFAPLRKPGTEWFAARTLEIKIVALGNGLPREILEGLSELLNARQALIDGAEGASIQNRLTNLTIWSDDRWRYDQHTHLLARAMMELTGSRDEWRARQPIEVQIDQLWRARLSGKNPFDVGGAHLQPSPLLDLLTAFRRLGDVA